MWVVAFCDVTLACRCADRVSLRCHADTSLRRSPFLRQYAVTPIAVFAPIRRYADRRFCADAPCSVKPFVLPQCPVALMLPQAILKTGAFRVTSVAWAATGAD